MWAALHSAHHTAQVVPYDLQSTNYQRNLVEAGYPLVPWQQMLMDFVIMEAPVERGLIFIEGHFSIGKSTVPDARFSFCFFL